MSELFSLDGGAHVDEAAAPRGRYLGQARIRLSVAAATVPLRPGAPGRIKEAFRLIVQAGRLVVGVHDYQRYVDHMRLRHPGVAPMSRDAFYRRCMEARYPGSGRGGTGCPC